MRRGLSSPEETGARPAIGLLRRAAAVRGGDGGVRRRAPLGPGVDRAWAHGSADPAGLREAVRQTAEERRGRRRGDLRGGAAADDALRAGEERGSAGERRRLPRPRPAGAPAHPAHERPARPFGGVRLCRPEGRHACRAPDRGGGRSCGRAANRRPHEPAGDDPDARSAAGGDRQARH